MRLPFLLAASLAIAACQTPPADDTLLQGTPYGEPLTLTETTAVSAILDDPGSYLGERVLVEGMVVAVCEMKGCWMDIASDREFEKIQIKVDDGVITFPMTAMGHRAVVEGVVEQFEMTEEEAMEEARRMAEEHGTEFDPASVTGPRTVLRIRGIGAIIAD